MLGLHDAKAIALREYQSAAIDGLRHKIREGQRRLILCAGTGAGKTVMAAHLLNEADRKGSYALFIVDRVALVDQTSAVLESYGIRHGVIQGINKNWAPRENVQVCSAQTLARRVLPRSPNLIVVDEAHAQYKATLNLMAAHPNAVKIGLTATPFTKGMADHWDEVVNVIPTRRLIESGFLVEPKIYVAKSPDDADLGLNSFGEFSDESAASAGIKIIGDVVTEWVKKTHEHFGGPAKTIVFSPTVEHGRELCAAFFAAGYNFQQISYLDKNESERAEKIAEFRRPDSIIHGLVSCGVLTKGFDVPDCRIGISCKPYRKSLSSHMQEIGRVMRSMEGERKEALWLCHSGNLERFAMEMFDVWENGAGDLSSASKRDSKPRERTEQVREKVVCPECSGALRGPICTACGWQRPEKFTVQTVEGEMREFTFSAIVDKLRMGVRAECAKDPRKVWDAALAYCVERSRDETKARKWAFGIWKGLYPEARMPSGWFDAAVRPFDPNAYALVDRETRRYRKKSYAHRQAINDNNRSRAA